MKIRKAISKIVGLIQATVGGIAIVLGFLLFYNIFDVQVMLSISGRNIAFYMLIFIIFGLLSIISGLFLLYEQ